MNEIKQWATMISSVSIISGVLICVLPKSSHKNLFKTITGIVLLYAVITPIIGADGIDFNIEDYLKDNYSVSENINKYALSSVVDSAEKAIEEILLKEAQRVNISCSFICECDVEDDKIVLTALTVTPELSDENMKIIEEFAVSLGFDKSIISFEGE